MSMEDTFKDCKGATYLKVELAMPVREDLSFVCTLLDISEEIIDGAVQFNSGKFNATV